LSLNLICSPRFTSILSGRYLLKRILLNCATVFAAGTAEGHEVNAGKLVLVHPWVRAAPAGAVMGGMMKCGGMGGMMAGDKIWAVNGVSLTGHVIPPFLNLVRGRS
jgi:hypothetical protein